MCFLVIFERFWDIFVSFLEAKSGFLDKNGKIWSFWAKFGYFGLQKVEISNFGLCNYFKS